MPDCTPSEGFSFPLRGKKAELFPFFVAECMAISDLVVMWRQLLQKLPDSVAFTHRVHVGHLVFRQGRKIQVHLKEKTNVDLSGAAVVFGHVLCCESGEEATGSFVVCGPNGTVRSTKETGIRLDDCGDNRCRSRRKRSGSRMAPSWAVMSPEKVRVTTIDSECLFHRRELCFCNGPYIIRPVIGLFHPYDITFDVALNHSQSDNRRFHLMGHLRVNAHYVITIHVISLSVQTLRKMHRNLLPTAH